MSFLRPNKTFSRVTCINPESLENQGFRCVLLDMDNTILPRDTHVMPDDIRAWIDELLARDIKVCLLSNNWHHGVYDLAAELNLPLVAKAIKPLPHAFLIARGKMKARRKETLCVGDQIFTDVCGAHLLGMQVYMVMPLCSTDLWHTNLLRKVEKALLGDIKPLDDGCFAAEVQAKETRAESAM